MRFESNIKGKIDYFLEEGKKYEFIKPINANKNLPTFAYPNHSFLNNRNYCDNTCFVFGEDSDILKIANKHIDLLMDLENLMDKYRDSLGIFSHIDLDGYGCKEYLRNRYQMEFKYCNHIDYDCDIKSDKFKEAIICSKILFITDLSLPEDSIKYICELRESEGVDGPIIWIDHHKTSVESTYEHKYLHKMCYGKIGISAATLCNIFANLADLANAFRNETEVIEENNLLIISICPTIVEIGLYDTFDPHMNEFFNFGMKLKLKDHNTWMDLFAPSNLINSDPSNVQSTIKSIIERGEHYKEYYDFNEKDIYNECSFDVDIVFVKDGGETEIAHCKAINRYGYSGMFGEDFDKYDGCIKFYQTSSGKWIHSIYSKNEKEKKLACDVICKLFGGGGHPGAAGFQSDKPLSDKLLPYEDVYGNVSYRWFIVQDNYKPQPRSIFR